MALTPNGIAYLSFEYGDSARMEGERFFDDLSETMLGNFLGGHPELEVVHYGSLMTFGITVRVGNRSSMRLFVAML